jgi:hypothetical protein
MKGFFVTLLLLGAAMQVRSEDAPAIGQPTIFWRNNEWEMFQNGYWVPYAEVAKEKAAIAAAEARAAEMLAAQSETPEVPAAPDSANVQTNDYESPQPYGYVMDLPTSGDHVGKARHGHRPRVPGFGNSSVGIGQPNLAIGQPTIGPGQMTPGIGQQPTLGQSKSAALCTAKTQGQTTTSDGPRRVQTQTRIGPGQRAFSTSQRGEFLGPR